MRSLIRTIPVLLFLLALNQTTQAASIINGSFEDPDQGPGPSYSFHPSILGWTSNDNFEIWANGLGGVSSYDGDQHLELNSFFPSTIFQDVTGITGGQPIDFSFAHRGRRYAESLNFSITDLGADNLLGGGDDTLLFSQVYSTGTSAWVLYSDTSLPALGNTTRFQFESLDGGSFGNFLDAVSFSQNQVPEPATLAVWGLFGVGLTVATRRRRKFDE